jgi:hypothetical protein
MLRGERQLSVEQGWLGCNLSLSRFQGQRIRAFLMSAFPLRTASLLLATILFANTCPAISFPGFPFPFPGGPSSSDIVSIIVYVIEKHEASERQKQIAQERARRAYANMSTKRKANLKAKKIRYIAVDTEKNDKTSPQAQKSVMVWDTESQHVAGRSVYDVKKAPPKGSTAKFDNYSAEYVGSGT